MAKQLANVKLFEGESGKSWQSSVNDLSLSVLCVSQFTLCANLKKGAKPDFHDAMPGEDSKKIFDHFCSTLRQLLNDPDRVKEGRFGSKMLVDIANDGPVTIVM